MQPARKLHAPQTNDRKFRAWHLRYCSSPRVPPPKPWGLRVHLCMSETWVKLCPLPPRGLPGAVLRSIQYSPPPILSRCTYCPRLAARLSEAMLSRAVQAAACAGRSLLQTGHNTARSMTSLPLAGHTAVPQARINQIFVMPSPLEGQLPEPQPASKLGKLSAHLRFEGESPKLAAQQHVTALIRALQASGIREDAVQSAIHAVATFKVTWILQFGAWYSESSPRLRFHRRLPIPAHCLSCWIRTLWRQPSSTSLMQAALAVRMQTSASSTRIACHGDRRT